jgi:hypothetical protein
MIQFYRVKLKYQGKFGENMLFPELTYPLGPRTKRNAIGQGRIPLAAGRFQPPAVQRP